MTPITQETITTMVHIVAERFRPDKVILFGSYARGNPTPDSDIDLLVVMNYAGQRLDLLRKIRASLKGILAPKDIVVRTPEEVEQYGSMIGTILYPALKEGKVLYAKD